MEEKDRDLECPSCADNRWSTLCDGGSNEEDCRYHTDHGRERQDDFDSAVGIAVEQHSHGNREENDLDGRHGNGESIHRYNSADKELRQEGRHYNRRDGRYLNPARHDSHRGQNV